VPADTVALSLHDTELIKSKLRTLAGYIISVTQGVDKGFNPILREVSGLTIGSNTTNDPLLNFVTESTSRDKQSLSRRTGNTQSKRKEYPEHINKKNVRSTDILITHLLI